MREGTAEPVQCLEHEAISPAASTPGSAGGPGDDRAPHGPSRSRDDANPLPPPGAHRAGGASSGDPCHSTPVWPTRMSGKPFLWAFHTRTPSDRMCCIHVGEFFGGCQDTLDRCREPLVCRTQGWDHRPRSRGLLCEHNGSRKPLFCRTTALGGRRGWTPWRTLRSPLVTTRGLRGRSQRVEAPATPRSPGLLDIEKGAHGERRQTACTSPVPTSLCPCWTGRSTNAAPWPVVGWRVGEGPPPWDPPTGGCSTGPS